MTVQPLLQVRGLTKRFPVRSGGFGRSATRLFTAVDAVSFDVLPGETLGLVGESGCGKTTTGRMIARLLDPTAGQIRMHVDGRDVDLVALAGEELRQFRRHVQMVFQDPYSSLNPRMRVFDIIAEPLRALTRLKPADLAERVHALTRSVGLSPEYLKRYPNAFSGGQRQRICIARSLALNPALVICDEPVSALDVSVRAQIINLLRDLQSERGLSYLFVAHDLAIVENVSSRVAVMYAGRIVETAPTASVFRTPRHPYTAALLTAVPRPDPDRPRDRTIPLDVAADNTPSSTGCPFHPRCPHAQPDCRSTTPPLRPLAAGHHAACHFAEALDLSPAALG